MSDITTVAQKKCSITQTLNKTVIELLRLAPANPIARAHAMNQLLKALPDNCQTFDQIQEWIETNITPKSPASIGTSSIRNRTTVINIGVEASEREYGSCHYSCDNIGSAMFPFTEGEILEAVDGAETWDAVIDNLDEYIRDNYADYISMNGGNYEHEDYETNDAEGFSLEYDRSRLRRLVREYLAANHPRILDDITD